VVDGTLPVIARANQLPLQIGRNGPVSQKYLRGKIDDVRLWNVVRSPGEWRVRIAPS
jgi:hypothetical protein